jgi:RimJ/RimL family protein N-acetyltransferase
MSSTSPARTDISVSPFGPQKDNTPARRLYERAGMTFTGKSAPFHRGTQLQYGCLLDA